MFCNLPDKKIMGYVYDFVQNSKFLEPLDKEQHLYFKSFFHSIYYRLPTICKDKINTKGDLRQVQIKQKQKYYIIQQVLKRVKGHYVKMTN